jgi:hypothetical protein
MGFLISLITLLPQILQFILQIEAAFKTVPAPTAGVKMGAVKKQILMDAVAVGTSDSKVTSAVSTITDSVVGTLNTAGVFTHG